MTEVKFDDECFEVAADEFLVGPDGDEDSIDIDDIFGKQFDQVYAEMKEFCPEAIEVRSDSSRFPSIIDPSYTLVDVEGGVLLLDPNGDPVGGYLSCDLTVDLGARGQGFGKELVIERCLRDGALPVWHLDTPSYSRAGHAAHIAAWRHARNDPAELDLRLARRAAADLREENTEIESQAHERGFSSVEMMILDAIKRVGRRGAEIELSATITSQNFAP